MDKSQMTKIERLDIIYGQARRVCDPIEFQLRHQNLLYAVAEALLEQFKPQDENEE